MKKRGLGRGLDVLLNKTKIPVVDEANAEKSPEKSGVDLGVVRELPIEFLVAGAYQPRRVFEVEALETLAESIKSQGIIQPLVVRKLKGQQGKYEILAGERRWRASQMAGLTKVPVIVQELTDQEALAVALIENIQREDLNVIEEAEAIVRFIDEFGLTHQEVGALIGRSRSAVSNVVRLLELTPKVRQMLLAKKIDMGHARAILSLKGAEQLQMAELIIEKSLTVRDVERLMKNGGQVSVDQRKIVKKDPDVKRLEVNLSELLGAKVGFHSSKKGKGKMTIHYDSLDQLDGILQKMGM